MRVDPEIEQLEADLSRSRFERWDVEAFFAERHQAKIDALTSADDRVGVWLQVAKELAFGVCAFVGFITIQALLGWLLLSGLA